MTFLGSSRVEEIGVIIGELGAGVKNMDEVGDSRGVKNWEEFGDSRDLEVRSGVALLSSAMAGIRSPGSGFWPLGRSITSRARVRIDNGWVASPISILKACPSESATVEAREKMAFTSNACDLSCNSLSFMIMFMRSSSKSRCWLLLYVERLNIII
jgi:hypothetical protein